MLIIEAALLCLPMLCAGYYGESTKPFLHTIMIVMLVALVLAYPAREARIFTE